MRVTDEQRAIVRALEREFWRCYRAEMESADWRYSQLVYLEMCPIELAWADVRNSLSGSLGAISLKTAVYYLHRAERCSCVAPCGVHFARRLAYALGLTDDSDDAPVCP